MSSAVKAQSCAILLLSCFIIFSFGCNRKQDKQPQELATLSNKRNAQSTVITAKPEVLNRKIYVHLNVRNPSDASPIIVEKRQLFQPEYSIGSLLDVTCEGKAIEYVGKMAKVGNSSGEDVVRVAPGANITGETEISLLFAFLPRKHSYQIGYSAFFSHPDSEDKLFEVKSSPETFTFDNR